MTETPAEENPTTTITNPEISENAEKKFQNLAGELAGETPEKNPETPRETWSTPLEFLLSCIAMSVGIGNFYRFPFVAYSNGGGAFLIPYLIVLFLVGKPIYFLELGLGQFCSRGQVGVWDVAPVFRGVGYGSTLASFCVVSYYVSVMALTVFYFFASFTGTLPWTVCDEDWENVNCTEIALSNGTGTSLAEFYFENTVLHLTPSITSGIGSPTWALTLCYLFSWLAVFFSIIRGVASSGKVAYFTALYPYVVLVVMLVTGALKEGATDGMWYFIRPQWGRLGEAKVWYAAVSQCFFSLSTGFGPIIMYASYNPFRHNVYRDAMIVSLIDTATSLLAGFTVFSILGNLAHEANVPIESVATSGPGLVFVSYADAIGKFSHVPQLFSTLFFLMLFSLGVGSAVSWQMAVITVICDQFPRLRKLHVTMVTCAACFLLGLVYVTPGGQQILTLVDNFSGNFVIYVLATLEIMAISWVYGLSNVVKDFEFMLGRKIGIYFKFCWVFFVPVFLFVILIYSLVTMETVEYAGVVLPAGAVAAGWTLATLCLGFVPLFAAMEIFKKENKKLRFLDKLRKSLQPNDSWGPKDAGEREEWVRNKGGGGGGGCHGD